MKVMVTAEIPTLAICQYNLCTLGGDPRTHLMHHAEKWTNLSGISDIKLNEFEGT